MMVVDKALVFKEVFNGEFLPWCPAADDQMAMYRFATGG